ncbi:MAG: hypothetical protein E6H78_18295 [Betaproteobacteria bacterium]|nr:MAG: hypothetical protein E6H78_18295 [Betaproteobacteria bacterium]
MERHGPEMVAVQATGELGEEGILGIGGDPFDDELLPGDAEGQGGAVFEQVLSPTGDARRGRRQRRMPLWIHRVLMERDRELDQEIG